MDISFFLKEEPSSSVGIQAEWPMNSISISGMFKKFVFCETPTPTLNPISLLLNGYQRLKRYKLRVVSRLRVAGAKPSLSASIRGVPRNKFQAHSEN
jgi:hypothetical protein